MPNVVNKKITDIDTNFANKGFRYEQDSVWERKLPKGIVVIKNQNRRSKMEEKSI